MVNHSTPQSIHCTLYTVQYVHSHSKVYTVQYVLGTLIVKCTLYAIRQNDDSILPIYILQYTYRRQNLYFVETNLHRLDYGLNN